MDHSSGGVIGGRPAQWRNELHMKERGGGDSLGDFGPPTSERKKRKKETRGVCEREADIRTRLNEKYNVSPAARRVKQPRGSLAAHCGRKVRTRRQRFGVQDPCPGRGRRSWNTAILRVYTGGGRKGKEDLALRGEMKRRGGPPPGRRPEGGGPLFQGGEGGWWGSRCPGGVGEPFFGRCALACRAQTILRGGGPRAEGKGKILLTRGGGRRIEEKKTRCHGGVANKRTRKTYYTASE